MSYGTLLLFSFLFFFSTPLAVFADFYKYLDDSGGLNVTNDYKSIPERYLADVTVIEESVLDEKFQAREREAHDERMRSEKKQRTRRTHILPKSPSARAPANGKAGTETEKSSSNKAPGWQDRQLQFLEISALIAFFIALAVAAGKLLSLFVPHALGIVIRVAIIAAVIVYIHNAYAERISRLF